MLHRGCLLLPFPARLPPLTCFKIQGRYFPGATPHSQLPTLLSITFAQVLRSFLFAARARSGVSDSVCIMCPTRASRLSSFIAPAHRPVRHHVCGQSEFPEPSVAIACDWEHDWPVGGKDSILSLPETAINVNQSAIGWSVPLPFKEKVRLTAPSTGPIFWLWSDCMLTISVLIADRQKASCVPLGLCKRAFDLYFLLWCLTICLTYLSLLVPMWRFWT